MRSFEAIVTPVCCSSKQQGLSFFAKQTNVEEDHGIQPSLSINESCRTAEIMATPHRKIKNRPRKRRISRPDNCKWRKTEVKSLNEKVITAN